MTDTWELVLSSWFFVLGKNWFLSTKYQAPSTGHDLIFRGFGTNGAVWFGVEVENLQVFIILQHKNIG